MSIETNLYSSFYPTSSITLLQGVVNHVGLHACILHFLDSLGLRLSWHKSTFTILLMVPGSVVVRLDLITVLFLSSGSSWIQRTVRVWTPSPHVWEHPAHLPGYIKNLLESWISKYVLACFKEWLKTKESRNQQKYWINESLNWSKLSKQCIQSMNHWVIEPRYSRVNKKIYGWMNDICDFLNEKVIQ